jgi:PAS domain-containing protein
MDFWSQFFE